MSSSSTSLLMSKYISLMFDFSEVIIRQKPTKHIPITGINQGAKPIARLRNDDDDPSVEEGEAGVEIFGDNDGARRRAVPSGSHLINNLAFTKNSYRTKDGIWDQENLYCKTLFTVVARRR